ncbi:ATP-binding protein, partial [candidate division WWE3 bacterium]|nr:ATP-binding protein [candidate division WWE3 bacterium]
MMFNNPYDNRLPVTDMHCFYGRVRQIRIIEQAIRTSRYCSVVGDRRIGKTSLLNCLQAKLSLENNVLPVFIDLEIGPSSERSFFTFLYKHLHAALLERLPAIAPQVPSVQEIRAFKYADEIIEYGIIKALENAFEELDSVHFLIDEGDYLAKANVGNGLRYILTSFVGMLGCVITSVQYLHEVSDIGPLSPLYNVFDVIELGLLEKDEAIALIKSKESPPS